MRKSKASSNFSVASYFLIFGLVNLLGPITLEFSIASAIQLPQTGQTSSFAPGDDGDIRAGVAWPNPRFIDNADNMITDKLTGLTWAKDTNVMATRDPLFDNDGTQGDGSVYWTTALSYIQKLNNESYLGLNDWRLPNIFELESLVDQENIAPALPSNHPFLNWQWAYWSSTTSWVLYMTYGIPGQQSINKLWGKTVVWPVRGKTSGTIQLPQTGQTTSYAPGDDGDISAGVAWPNPRFTDNGNGSITDNLTGLMWTKNANLMADRDPTFSDFWAGFLGAGPGTVAWGIWPASALDYIQKLNNESYLGFNDWRLPNIKEFRSLIDHQQPYISDNPFFINVQNAYWTSNTEPHGLHWLFYPYGGGVDWDNANNVYYVWPVRGGASAIMKGYITGYGNCNVTNLGTLKPIWGVFGKKELLEAESGEKLKLVCEWLNSEDQAYHILPSFVLYYISPENQKYRIGTCPFEGGCNEAWFLFIDNDKDGEPDYFLRTQWTSSDYGLINDDKIRNAWTSTTDLFEDKLDWAVSIFNAQSKTLTKLSYKFDYAWGPPILCCGDCSSDPETGEKETIEIDPPLGPETEAFFNEIGIDLQSLPPDIPMAENTSLPCDFDNNGTCNESDIQLFQQNILGKCQDDANYNPIADIDGNGCIDSTDQRFLFEQDYDGDGIPDEEDNCPNTRNPDQKDSDNDGIGNSCEKPVVTPAILQLLLN